MSKSSTDPYPQWQSPDKGIRIHLFHFTEQFRAQIFLKDASELLIFSAPVGTHDLQVGWIPKGPASTGPGGDFYYRLCWLDRRHRVLASVTNDPLLGRQEGPRNSKSWWQTLFSRLLGKLVVGATLRLEIPASPLKPSSIPPLQAPTRREGSERGKQHWISFARTEPLDVSLTQRID